MKLYNSLHAKKCDFSPINENEVKMYACGPTVYNYFHIGNARAFVVFDMLRRYLEYRGNKVTFVQNFTDIDDKMIKKANEENTTVKEIADRYIKEYFIDAKGLGIKEATVHPRATENIDEIISIVSTLIEKGYAYESSGDVYFSPKKFNGYGKLSHMPMEDLLDGARVEVGELKKEAVDFALWKAAKPGEPSWDSPWGKGRPGWHIECSAMVHKYLGDSIDIHGGGIDLTFPHHENEIAQSEALTDKPFVNYWLHNGYINVDNKKMSKSLGNFFTVRDVAEKYGYLPIRFFILSSHYRSPVNFSAEIIEQGKAALERIANCKNSLDFFLKNAEKTALLDSEKEAFAALDTYREKFIENMDDDFNTAGAIGVIFELCKDINMKINGENPSYELIAKANEIFTELVELMGLIETSSDDDDQWILDLIEERKEAKKAKNYARADEIRSLLSEKGIILEDTPQGTKYKKA